MKYRVHVLIGWLYDTANALDWRVPILDILETERRYPGLMDDLGIESWQRKIIKEQLEGTGKPKETIDE